MIYKRNKKVYYLVRFLMNVIFTMPIWITFYQGRITEAQISLLVAIQFLVQMLIEIPSGAIADLLGRKRTISLGIIIGIIGIVLVPFATEFWHFLLLISCTGILDAFISGAEEALLYDSLKQDKIEKSFKEVYSKAYIILQTGLVTGALLGGILYSINQNLPFFAEAFSMLIALIASLFYIEPAIDSEKFSFRSYKTQLKQGIKESFKNPTIARLSLYFIAVGGITWSSQMYFNTTFLTEIIASDPVRGFIQGSIRLINVLLIFFFFSKTKLFTLKHKIISFPLAMAIAYLPGFLIKNEIGVLIIYLATLTATLRWIFMSEIINPHLESRYRATAISTLSMGVNLVNIFIYLISSFIIPKWGIGVMYTFLGILSIIFVLPITLKILREKDYLEER